MTTDTIEFPPIDAAAMATAAKTATSIATTEAQPVDLAKLDLTAVALAGYGDWRKDVAATKANLSTLVLDLSTPTKIKEARTLRQRLIGDPLAAVRKVAAGIKSKMAQTSKAVGAELEQIEAAYAEADALILPQIEQREAELEREREEARKREEVRKEKHRTNIAAIRVYVDRASAPGMTAERIARGIAQLESLQTPTTETWEEFAVPAANAICETLEKMRALHAKALSDEAAAAEAERVRKENEELRARLAAAEAAAQAAAKAAAELEAARAVEASKISTGMAPAADEPANTREGASGAACLATQDTPQQGANRDASAGQSHVAEGSASPAGRGADGPTACGAAPVSLPGGIVIHGPLSGSTTIIPQGCAVASVVLVETDEKPTLKLGDLNDWLKLLSVSAAQLEALGFQAHAERNAKLYKPSDKARIKAALIEWLERLA